MWFNTSIPVGLIYLWMRPLGRSTPNKLKMQGSLQPRIQWENYIILFSARDLDYVGLPKFTKIILNPLIWQLPIDEPSKNLWFKTSMKSCLSAFEKLVQKSRDSDLGKIGWRWNNKSRNIKRFRVRISLRDIFLFLLQTGVAIKRATIRRSSRVQFRIRTDSN